MSLYCFDQVSIRPGNKTAILFEEHPSQLTCTVWLRLHKCTIEDMSQVCICSPRYRGEIIDQRRVKEGKFVLHGADISCHSIQRAFPKFAHKEQARPNGSIQMLHWSRSHRQHCFWRSLRAAAEHVAQHCSRLR